MKKDKFKTIDMEMAIASYFGFIKNVIVPNASWGIGVHECDLFILTTSNCGIEVEIKISRADLIKDKEKGHGHNSHKIKDLYFAIPTYLEKDIEHIPEQAGILIVGRGPNGKICCTCRRNPKSRKPAYKFSDKEKFKIARLGAMRIWGLKRKLIQELRQPRMF